MPSPPFHNSWIRPCPEYIIPPHRTLLGPASVSCMVTGDRERECVSTAHQQKGAKLTGVYVRELFVGVSEVEVLCRERQGRCCRGCYY